MRRASLTPSSPQRRRSHEVRAGSLGIGGANPVRVQSMLTCDTRDVAASVGQAAALAGAGCELVRLTAPTVAAARALREIRRRFSAAGFARIPLCADIHFLPAAAFEALEHVEKVRINPGNFADRKHARPRVYTDAAYALELERLRDALAPLLARAKALGRALRVGVNHGSLSDRVLNRHGDTPEGMVESALEYLRAARDLSFDQIVVSLKTSNPRLMIHANRLLAERMAAENLTHPLHLGVTEAGEGEDGRVKSAIGIGSLLRDGLGDTIRVSLTEDSVREIPVARALVALTTPPPPRQPAATPPLERGDLSPLSTGRPAAPRPAARATPPRVLLTRRQAAALPDTLNPDTPVEGIYENIPVLEIDPADPAQIAAANKLPQPVLAALPDKLPSDPVDAHRLLAARLDPRHAILLKDTLDPASEPPAAPALLSALRLGALLCDGIGDAVLLRAEPNPAAALALAYNILQAAGARVTKTEYISCPSCGRTLFDIQPAARRVREKTAHLKGLKIAVMGCIVNGPGEMAGADFGYVGGAPGKINLYAGRDCVAVNIPETEAVDRLVALIRQHGKWVEPPAPVLPAENSGASG